VLATFVFPSVKLRACFLALALSMLHGLPCVANEDVPAPKSDAKIEAKVEARQIAWNDAPAYIQEQIKNVVLNCTEGTLTPDKARIFEYTAPKQLSHYVYDYTAWANHPLPINCQNSPMLCGEAGCLMSVYTQIKSNVFKQSLRTYILSVSAKEIAQHQPAGSANTTAAFEMVQNKFSCRLVNGGSSNCTLYFTWKDNKFTYFGFGAKDDQPALEPPREKLQAEPEEATDE